MGDGPRPLDPPIIIGGGGSTYIWIKKGFFKEYEYEKGQPYGGPTPPGDPTQYVVYKSDENIVSARVWLDNHGTGPHDAQHDYREKYSTRFYKSKP